MISLLKIDLFNAKKFRYLRNSNIISKKKFPHGLFMVSNPETDL